MTGRRRQSRFPEPPAIPHRAHGELLADIDAADPSTELLHLWWLGQSGFLVAHAGRQVLLDPYLSDSLTRKYAGTDLPHVRLTQLVVEPHRLTGVDVVTASHGHTDHLDADTLAPLLAAAPQAVLVAPAAHRALALERSGVDPGRLLTIDDGESLRAAGFEIRAVPAAHEAVERDGEGRMRFLGYVVGAGPFRLYHAGDTIPYDGMPARVGAVDVALLPINGRAPERGVAGNMTALEAADLAAALPAAVAVPCHFGTFAFNTAPPEPFADACAKRGVRARVLRAGERLTLTR